MTVCVLTPPPPRGCFLPPRGGVGETPSAEPPLPRWNFFSPPRRRTPVGSESRLNFSFLPHFCLWVRHSSRGGDRLGPSWEHLGVPWWGSGGVPRPPEARPVRKPGDLTISYQNSQAPWPLEGVSERSRGRLGDVLGRLGGVLGRPGGVLGSLGSVLEAFWRPC